MMKRFSAVAVAVLLVVSSSFASWDYFPPKDAGSGEAKLSFDYTMWGDFSFMNLAVGARYTIIDGLEASVKLPVPLSSCFDGNCAEDYVGLSIPEIGVRYWLPMGVGFFADLLLPVDTRDGVEPDFDMVVGVQYSMEINEQLSFGSEVRLLNLINDFDMGLGIGLELDYNLGMATPFLGIELPDLLAEGDFMMELILGCGFEINEKMGAQVDLRLGLAGYGDDMPIGIGASFSFGF